MTKRKVLRKKPRRDYQSFAAMDQRAARVLHRQGLRQLYARLAGTGPEQHVDFLYQETGKDRRWWFALVQLLIADATSPTKDPNHGRTELIWVNRLRDVVEDHLPKKGNYDGNMKLAAITGYILMLWFARIQRAKAYDPRRPKQIRQRALERWTDYSAHVMLLFTQESCDSHMLPGQHWDPPYSVHAVDGTFL